jgi:hypothetical protein
VSVSTLLPGFVQVLIADHATPANNQLLVWRK